MGNASCRGIWVRAHLRHGAGPARPRPRAPNPDAAVTTAARPEGCHVNTPAPRPLASPGGRRPPEAGAGRGAGPAVAQSLQSERKIAAHARALSPHLPPLPPRRNGADEGGLFSATKPDAPITKSTRRYSYDFFPFSTDEETEHREFKCLFLSAIANRNLCSHVGLWSQTGRGVHSGV